MKESEKSSLTRFQHPRLPIPPPLMMSEPGTFAHLTLTQRWPAIASRIISENEFPPEIVQALETLVNELFNGMVRQLNDEGAPDAADWANSLQPYLGKSWLDVPWYFAEAYFYRRILEATRYFQPGQWQGIDPFASQKQAGLEFALEAVSATCTQLNSIENETKLAFLRSLLYSDLWGNQADLSLKPTQTYSRSEVQESHILADDTSVVIDRLTLPQERIDFILDNAGSELLGDLYLVDFLLSSQSANTIYLHLKAHPTFVSDATCSDFHHTLVLLAADIDSDVRCFAQRLQGYLTANRLKLCADLFWTSPLVFWQMPQVLQLELDKANLIVVKGDANYRRLLGDCHWKFTTPIEDITCYFPAPFVALRTLKSEIVAGLNSGQIAAVSREDSDWLIDGEWGVIQFVNPTQ